MSVSQRWTLTVVCAATAMLMLDIAVVNTALSAIASDLDTGLSGLQWVVDAYTLVLAATVLTAGALADRFGRRRRFALGIGVFTATSLLCAASQSIGAGLALLTVLGVDSAWWLFLPGLLVAMVGTGILNPIVSQVALSSVAPEQSGLAAGVNDMFRQAGIAVGVAALGALIPARAAFGDGSAQAYVDGFHDALWAGAALAVAAAGAVAVLLGRAAERRETISSAIKPLARQ
jgi:MFS family permease